MQSDVGARSVVQHVFADTLAKGVKEELIPGEHILKWVGNREVILRDGETGTVKIRPDAVLDKNGVYTPLHIKFKNGIWAQKHSELNTEARIRCGID